MLTLCGFSVSNYYNKTKLALLEKGIAFVEEAHYPAQTDEMLKISSMGKVPFLKTDKGILTESQVLAEYIEDCYPEPSLYPKDAFERARCRELITHLELHLELPARRLYGEAFFGGSVSDAVKAEVEVLLKRGLHSLATLAKFSPYIAGDQFTHADCAAFVHLPLVSQTSKIIYGRDMLAETFPAVANYIKLIASRPHAMKVSADREAGMAAFFAARK